jgi:hypothetical protein
MSNLPTIEEVLSNIVEKAWWARAKGQADLRDSEAEALAQLNRIIAAERLNEQKAVTEWLTDAEHIETIRDFNRLRRIKLEAKVGDA